MKRTNEIERRPHEHTFNFSLTSQLLKPPKTNKNANKIDRFCFKNNDLDSFVLL